MIKEIKDHFILVDKCAEQTRIVENNSGYIYYNNKLNIENENIIKYI